MNREWKVLIPAIIFMGIILAAGCLGMTEDKGATEVTLAPTLTAAHAGTALTGSINHTIVIDPDGKTTILGDSSTPTLGIDEENALNAVKNQSAEVRAFLQDENLRFVGKVIRTEKSGDLWYVAFIQPGSGVPIISATCYSVNASGAITMTGSSDHPKVMPDKFSATGCR